MFERELRELEVEWPRTPDVAGVVEERIAGATRSGRHARADLASPRRRRSGRPLLALAAALTLAGGTATAVTLLDDVDSARVAPGPVTAPAPDPGRLGAGLQLGQPIATIPVAPPSVLRAPDAAYERSDGAISYVFAPQAGIPAAAATGVAVLMTVFEGDFRPGLQKTLGQDTRSRRLRVGRDPALYLSGAAHGFAFADGDAFSFEEQRLAGDTLLVQRGARLLRLEADAPLARLVAIARSVER
jgi:hypothetical protein